MNCRRARRAIVVGRMDSRLLTHLETCEGCRRWAERDERLRRLLREQRTVSVAEDASERLLQQVRRRVLAERAEDRRWLQGWFPTLSLPLARYTIAATFLAMITFHWLVAPSPQTLSPQTGAHVFGRWTPESSASIGWAPFAPLGFRESALIPPWTDSVPLSTTNIGSVGINYGINLRPIMFSE